MRLRTLFLIMCLPLVGVWVFMLVFFGTGNAAAVYMLEAATVATLLLLVWFYRMVLRPVDTLSDALDMLRSQDWNSSLRPVGQPEVDRVIGVFNHMLATLRNERVRYEEQTHLLNRLTESTASGVIIADNLGRVVLSNPAAEAILSLRLKAATPVSDAGEFAACAARLKPGSETTIRVASGATVRVTCQSFINSGMTYCFYTLDNVTTMISEAERSGYEKVIRTMSHEVNNTVGGLTSALSTISAIGVTDPEIAEMLDSCCRRATSLGDFVSRYAAVVKIPAPQLGATDISQLLARAACFMQSVAASQGVECTVDPGSGLPMVMADVALLEQALVNIVKNGAESVAGRPDGFVRVEAALSAEGEVTVTVTDNGRGLTPQSASLIFTPFFTDKPGGHGLGLMAVREILRGHGCRFTLATSPADGLTRFTIRFPRQ